jgi:tubulin-specific chaperone D
MIPFDLAQFDEDGQPGRTAEAVESIGKSYLGKAGIDRDAAALLLSRLYMRCVDVELRTNSSFGI